MRKICVIGAGVSGLTTAKSFLSKGFDVTVYEKGNSIGGVWAKERSYPEVTTQTTRDAYSYSDFSMPDHYPDWPSGAQVFDYLTDYAKHFNVTPCIKLNTSINSINRKGTYWEVEVQTGENVTTELFDFVAICSGTFHKSYTPQFPYADQFIKAGGKIMHSSEVNDISVFDNKHVVTVGFAKSATDISVLAAERAKSSTLIYRKAQWKVPRYFGNKVNMKYLLFSRASEAFFGYHRKSAAEKILHSIGKPMVWMQWRGLEALLKWQYDLKKCNMLPSHRIEDQISCSLGVEPVGFYKRIKEGSIRAINTTINAFTEDGVILENKQKIKADIVIFGTGFKQNIDFLEERFRKSVIGQSGSFNLYRNIIHPDVPNLAFVGFNSSLFTTLTSEIAARWVVSYALGEVKIPERTKMLKSIEEEQHWRKSVRPIASEFSGTCVAPFNYHHLDDLMRDMGKRTRASSNFFLEGLKPIDPKDYKKILG
jgi:cation diffusion facilitator CzcD-associated flavoprotein CzcO